MDKSAATKLSPGPFVRVRADHEDTTRAGRDGMVVSAGVDSVGLMFGSDRNNRDQHTRSVGIEAWQFDELDLAMGPSAEPTETRRPMMMTFLRGVLVRGGHRFGRWWWPDRKDGVGTHRLCEECGSLAAPSNRNHWSRRGRG